MDKCRNILNQNDYMCMIFCLKWKNCLNKYFIPMYILLFGLIFFKISVADYVITTTDYIISTGDFIIGSGD